MSRVYLPHVTLCLGLYARSFLSITLGLNKRESTKGRALSRTRMK